MSDTFPNGCIPGTEGSVIADQRSRIADLEKRLAEINAVLARLNLTPESLVDYVRRSGELAAERDALKAKSDKLEMLVCTLERMRAEDGGSAASDIGRLERKLRESEAGAAELRDALIALWMGDGLPGTSVETCAKVNAALSSPAGRQMLAERDADKAALQECLTAMGEVAGVLHVHAPGWARRLDALIAKHAARLAALDKEGK